MQFLLRDCQIICRDCLLFGTKPVIYKFFFYYNRILAPEEVQFMPFMNEENYQRDNYRRLRINTDNEFPTFYM